MLSIFYVEKLDNLPLKCSLLITLVRRVFPMLCVEFSYCSVRWVLNTKLFCEDQVCEDQELREKNNETI